MWSSRHWVPEIWTWLYSLKSQKTEYVSPHFYIFMENQNCIFSNCRCEVCNFPSSSSHCRPWMILMDFSPLLISMKLFLFSQTVSDEDLFEARESCISKKTHFHFDYLWNEHRWERCKFREKNKQESWHRCLSAKLIKISFLLLSVCFQYVCVYVCVCAFCDMKTINNGHRLLLVTHIGRNKNRMLT